MLFRFSMLLILALSLSSFSHKNILSIGSCADKKNVFQIETRNIYETTYSSSIPFQFGQPSIFVEAVVEDTEDELQTPSPQSCNTLSQKVLLEEIAYTIFLKSRYLGLAISLNRQSEIPYFILHHSWRNQIA